MKIHQVTDPEFKSYGRVVEGLDIGWLLAALEKTPLTEEVCYVPREPLLEQLPAAPEFAAHLYGGMPAELGWCNGRNTRLNCLEYHRDSEFNLATEDFILLLAKQDEIAAGALDTAKVKAFRVPAGMLVEVYATTLHYVPCHTDAQKGFRVMVALPAGTNLEKPAPFGQAIPEDKLLWACNKWLLAHTQAKEAAEGAYVGLVGENLDLSQKEN